MMTDLGGLCNLRDQSDRIISDCKGVTQTVKSSERGSVLYLIWQKPWMAAGKHTFIDHVLNHLGYTNVVKEDRYPTLSDQDITRLSPDYIFFSSEPFPFKETHLKLAECNWPKASCRLVDGELYSWYGSRLRFWDPENR